VEPSYCACAQAKPPMELGCSRRLLEAFCLRVPWMSCMEADYFFFSLVPWSCYCCWSYVHSARYDLVLKGSANSEIGIHLFSRPGPIVSPNWLILEGRGRARDKSETLTSWAYRCRFRELLAAASRVGGGHRQNYARAGWILLV
jgi:hypothetical protein